MLGTRDRTLLLESLRPPPGYRLGRAVGTSYTLDLIALLTAPLAFTFFDVHDDDGAPVADPVALLEALRRHAEKVTLFCQAGAIAVPKPEQTLLAYLEGSVVEVRPPLEDGIFHPKVWVLEFTGDEEPAIYRVLCLSRNLTFDRAWDTCLGLEGRLTGRSRGYRRNAPLADLLAALPGLATRRLPTELREDLARMADEVRRVDFQPPTPFEDFQIHPLGLTPAHAWPFPESSRSLAVSPYLVGSVVERLTRDHGLEVLISRPQAFEEVLGTHPAGALPKRRFVLSPGANLDAREADEDDGTEPSQPADRPELTGLHAKLFLFEDGRTARLFTGSANATLAAFQLNVELLVELVGKAKDCGIDALLGSEDDETLDSLRTILQEYTPAEDPEPIDDEQRALDRRADRVAHALGSARLTATVREVDAGQLWDVALSGKIPEVPDDAEIRVWPVTLSSQAALPVRAGGDETIATFEGLSFEALTGFFAFEVSLREGRRRASRSFTVTVELLGAPEDRKERLLRSFLKNRRQVLRLLLLLLMDEGADVSLFVQAARDDGKDSKGFFGGWDEPTLLEALLRSLSRDPERIEQAARLIRDLGKTPEGRDLLPEGLDEIWGPVWAAREELRR
jgi:hypothetical protein